MKKLFVIVGKASAGKDTLVQHIMKNDNIKMALSFTTRPRRSSETQGVEYDFITREEFWEHMSTGDIIEYTSYNVANGETWYYGLTKQELEKNDYVAVIVNPEGVKQLEEYYGDRIVTILVDANPVDRIKRYLDRDNDKSEIKVAECCRRFLADMEDFKDFNPKYTIHNNGEIVDAICLIEQILGKEFQCN